MINRQIDLNEAMVFIATKLEKNMKDLVAYAESVKENPVYALGGADFAIEKAGACSVYREMCKVDRSAKSKVTQESLASFCLDRMLLGVSGGVNQSTSGSSNTYRRAEIAAWGELYKPFPGNSLYL